MRASIASILAIGLLAASCAAETSDEAGDELGSPATVSTSPVATSPVTTSPVNTSAADDAPVETSPEPTVPHGDQQDAPDPAEEESPVTTNLPKDSPETGTPITSVEPLPEGPLASAVADLADRLGVDDSVVTVVTQEEVTWPDQSLGCPQPDMRYAQVLVNGSLIVLDVGGTAYEYHSGGGRGPFYCANPTKPTSGGYGDV